MKRTRSPERIELAASVDVLSKNYTAREIAEITGKTHACIKSIAQDFGISFYVPKIDDHDRYLMKQLRACGLKLREIAVKFEVTPGCVSVVCKGVSKYTQHFTA